MSDTTMMTVKQIARAVAEKKLSAVEALRGFMGRIAAHEPRVHAFNELYADRAMERAKGVDEGRITGPLAGVPIAIKDNLCTRFGHTTCSSKILAPFKSPYDATVVKKLEAAGAVIVGKTNLDEFAMGSSTENSATGPTKNPWHTDYVPGGSSGGSAAAVAADFAPASLGSDTGGSIRQPAALCGVVGLKPTYGLVSRYGLVAFASSLDQIGPFARTVEDCALVLGAIAGFDPMDSTSAPDEVSGAGDYTRDLEKPVENLRLGVAKQYMSDANDPAVARAASDAIGFYREQGAEIVEVDLPHTDYGIPTYYIVATAEASSNLARYDGVHFGYRTPNPTDLVDLYSATRAEGFGDEVKRRIMLGTFALSAGYHDAFYNRALKVRRLIKQDFDGAFEKCDAILCPTAPTPAFKFGAKSGDPLQMYLSDVYTVNANLAGIAGLSIPCGFAEAEGATLPIGLQLLGPTFSERKLLRIARAFERAHDFSFRRPPLG